MRRDRGFTLIDMMMCVAITAALASMAISSFPQATARAKRSEGLTGLRALWDAEQQSKAATGNYSASFATLDFSLYGGTMVSPTVYQGPRYTYQLSQSDPQSFSATATADLDGDSFLDILVISDSASCPGTASAQVWYDDLFNIANTIACTGTASSTGTASTGTSSSSSSSSSASSSSSSSSSSSTSSTSTASSSTGTSSSSTGTSSSSTGTSSSTSTGTSSSSSSSSSNGNGNSNAGGNGNGNGGEGNGNGNGNAKH